MTIQQIIKDALAWCKYFAVNESIGAPEARLLFYEAYQTTYLQAALSHPEFYTISASFSGTSWTIPAGFRKARVFVVNDAACISGYARIIPPTEWDTRQANTRSAANVTDPQCYKSGTTFVISPTVTSGTVYYVRNFSEVDFSDETKDITLFLPLVYYTLLLAEMTYLIRVRHFQLPNTPNEWQKHMALMHVGTERMKNWTKPLDVGSTSLSETPQTVLMAQ